jgi:hypothetical protein
MAGVTHMRLVSKALEAQAQAHKKAHQQHLMDAAVARAEADANQPPEVPQTGLQPPYDAAWDMGGD